MKHKIPLFIILLFAVISCRLLSPQEKAGEQATFETDAFSFIVPEGWLWGGSVEDYFGTLRKVSWG